MPYQRSRKIRTVERPAPLDKYLDTELRILHTKRECPMAKTAVKYGFLVNQTGTAHLAARAKGLGWKGCPKCGTDLAQAYEIPTAEGIKSRR